jgi:hypothetical protein
MSILVKGFERLGKPTIASLAFENCSRIWRKERTPLLSITHFVLAFNDSKILDTSRTISARLARSPPDVSIPACGA